MRPRTEARPLKGSPDEVRAVSSDALAHGITIAGSIVLFLWAGDLLDKRIGTSPLFAFLGLAFGAGASFYRMYLHLVIVPRQNAEARKKEEDG